MWGSESAVTVRPRALLRVAVLREWGLAGVDVNRTRALVCPRYLYGPGRHPEPPHTRTAMGAIWGAASMWMSSSTGLNGARGGEVRSRSMDRVGRDPVYQEGDEGTDLAR